MSIYKLIDYNYLLTSYFARFWGQEKNFLKNKSSLGLYISMNHVTWPGVSEEKVTDKE